MQELVFVALFVLALAIGWFLGRREAIRVGVLLNPHPSALDKQYFIGLNYLLNEQPDEAIETFIRALEVNPETVETHIAIGKLFRQRGDVERAIRIHQNLLARPNLSREQGDRVQLELARDYLAVGLDQRAQRLLDGLINSSALRAEALADRVRLCERERDWRQAIEHGELLSRMQPDFAVALAHYHCEQAEQLACRGESSDARRQLRRALDCDPGCARAMLMLASLEYRQQAPLDARRWLQRLADTDAALVPLALPLIQQMAAEGQLDVLDYLGRITAGESPALETVLAQAEVLRQQQGDRAASDFVLLHLRKSPSLGGLLYLVDLHLGHSEPGARENLLLLRDILQRLSAGKVAHRCTACGFSASLMYWQCPACHAWSTMRPIAGLRRSDSIGTGGPVA